MVIKHQKTKTLVTKPNGRSSDAVSPNFIYGCAGGCMVSYCYVGRFNDTTVYINDNVDDILASIESWVDKQPWPKEPNQCDDRYYTIDIGCSTDIALHHKHYDWQKVFTFFNEHPKLKSTFATKYPNRFPLDDYIIDPTKNRIRVSLMPQIYAEILEPNTTRIDKRIASIKDLQKKFEVHINFSPIIIREESNWLYQYGRLFNSLRVLGIDVPCECIFMTYSDIQAKRNQDSEEGKRINVLLYNPAKQEYKKSEYGGINLRYSRDIKPLAIDTFKAVYRQYFDVTNIRYIF
jgi:spore photoproduct lyase